ncbi:hypothetical protein [Parasulfitobacter algicola]|uniref:Uncharacterized protein n=1 Tax=Parasulfitobacter algicola TaxID=2614809 RepID=A0ABX2IVG7_9RHOB|nr:hypothetical protein [Sulfitobacter algicola]NSX56914.1 hypothetical protein [Sulfitobacter algicola]
MMRVIPYIGTLLLVVMAVVAGWLAFQTVAHDPPAPQSVNVGINAQTADQNTLSLPSSRPDVYYAAITERPLFEPGRRPFVIALETPDTTPQNIAPQPQPQEWEEAPEIALLGVMQLSEQPSALLSINNQPPTWHMAGAIVAGWTLNEIENNWIELTRETRRLRVDMYQ